MPKNECSSVFYWAYRDFCAFGGYRGWWGNSSVELYYPLWS